MTNTMVLAEVLDHQLTRIAPEDGDGLRGGGGGPRVLLTWTF